MVHSGGVYRSSGPAARAVLGDRPGQVPGGDEKPGDDGRPLRKSQCRVPEQEARGGEYIPSSFAPRVA